MILIYITCKDEDEAEKVSEGLLEKKLIACANYFPINSLYKWKGKLQNDDEVVLLCKTKEEKYEEIKEIVKKMHSYNVPCILRIDCSVNKEYLDWVETEVK